MTTKSRFRAAMPACAALSAIGFATAAHAQTAESADDGLDVIIVTAQKREQSIQDVPIAVTALGGEELLANRVSNVSDLAGLAPGLTMTTSAGGQQIPFFIMRGAQSTGLVPGSDKQVSIYLDGVYIGSTRGSIFDLPDTQRIEVLRGPQGTLFGRNATAGAVSITTRDPTGDPAIKAAATLGNYGHYNIRTSIDLPQFGPVSAYVTYQRNYKRGDHRNLAAGQVWDRTASELPRIAKVLESPKYLGTTDLHSVFAAVKIEQDDFKLVYKFDYAKDKGTPRGTGLIGYDANRPLLGNLLDTLIKTQPFTVPIDADARRDSAVANGFATPFDQSNEGHSVTATYTASDSLSFKNVFAFRKSFIFSPSSIDGISSLTITPQAIPPFATLVAFSTLPPANAPAAIPGLIQAFQGLVGSPYVPLASQAQGSGKQWSDELQVNYDSDFLTATVGLLWFKQKDDVSAHMLKNTTQFSPIPGGVFTNEGFGTNFNKATSLAAYTQLEFHVLPQLDVVAGGRITRDRKSGTFTYDSPSLGGAKTLAFSYRKTKPSFLFGVNWKPNDDTLVYAKWSNAFVSGGSVAGLDFAPETASSIEGGVKTELWNRRVRANLSVYHVKYKHVQGASAPTTPETVELVINATGDPELPGVIGTFVADLGTIEATGFEFDFTAVPAEGLTVGGNLSYTDSNYVFVHPLQIASDGVIPKLLNRAPWRGGVFGQYDTPPLFGDAYLSFRADGFWQDKLLLTPRPDDAVFSSFGAPVRDVPDYWLVNGRISLRDVDLGGIRTEVALWGKNVFDKRVPNFGLNLGGILASANYIPARTYGIDLIAEF